MSQRKNEPRKVKAVTDPGRGSQDRNSQSKQSRPPKADHIYTDAKKSSANVPPAVGVGTSPSVHD